MNLPTLFVSSFKRVALRAALILCATTCVVALADDSAKQGYAIVATQSVLDDADWAKVVDSLRDKYADEFDVAVVAWDDSAFDRLKELFPKYACFVVKPEEATKERLATIWQGTRALDDDPYGDVIFGIITGYDAGDALRMAQVKPMTVESAVGATSIASKYFKNCIIYDELKKNLKRVKEAGKEEVVTNDGPDDTTRAIADALDGTQLFVTSGHASERNWSIGYSYVNGFFVANDGELFGVPSKNSGEEPFSIKAGGSKIHIASGNCLLGDIDNPCCMALMMVRHANVDMLVGYVVTTWFGYMGWGVQDYYIEQPGRFTVAEAVYANNQALLNLLESDDAAPEAEKLPAMRREGLLHDRDVVAIYGDPAWQNALAVQESGWNQTLESEKAEDGSITWTLTIEPNRGDKSFDLIDPNGSERSNRPIFQILPQRVKDVKIIEGQECGATITDDFVLIPLKNLPKDKFSLKFTSK
ncbi:MAG: hypothetical protein IK077_07545 [Thermoguttaceae bacterium]|nr:hypothetical protein [Thermoguttaceae bacterium]